ncbi:MAG: beta-galactosidase [Myxococcota bacterium]|jgi:beta-galactosidase
MRHPLSLRTERTDSSWIPPLLLAYKHPMLPLLLLTSCKDRGDDSATAPFPATFLWGSATAGFQVDMGCPTWPAETCDDTASDWYQWVTTDEIIADAALFVSGEPVSHGPGMWELFEEDADAMADAGLNAYRMSLEWSRLFPDGAAESAETVEELAAYADAGALARYHEMFAALDAHGITPLVTLNHYTLPLWVHDGVACHNDPEGCTANGWVNGERIQRLIGLYTGYAAREFGGEVDQWATLNEPFATTLSGYLLPGEDRSAPPGLLMAADQVVATLRHQIEGHAVMYDAVVAYDTVDADGDGAAAQIGIVLNMVAITPETDSAEDAAAAEHMDHLYHRLFLDALTAGSWDEDLDGTFDTTRPELAGRLDWLGINYYNQVVARSWVQLLTEIPVFDFYPEFSWEPYPEGLGAVVDIAAAYDVPIIITENGTPYVETQGVEVLEGHLTALSEAMGRGADVRGYLYWSWVDNYEWNHGFDLKFGLNALNGDTKAREPRPVLGRLSELAAGGAL